MPVFIVISPWKMQTVHQRILRAFTTETTLYPHSVIKNKEMRLIWVDVFSVKRVELEPLPLQIFGLQQVGQPS